MRRRVFQKSSSKTNDGTRTPNTTDRVTFINLISFRTYWIAKVIIWFLKLLETLQRSKGTKASTRKLISERNS